MRRSWLLTHSLLLRICASGSAFNGLLDELQMVVLPSIALSCPKRECILFPMPLAARAPDICPRFRVLLPWKTLHIDHR